MDRYDQDPDILSHVTNADLRTFGMIPEFLGRLPDGDAAETNGASDGRDSASAKNAILKQYVKLLELDEENWYLKTMHWLGLPRRHETLDTARALRAIIEDFMLDIMYQIPKDPNIGSVIITRSYLEKSGGPRISMTAFRSFPGTIW